MVVDVLWFIFIFLVVWNRDDYKNLAGWETGNHWFVAILCVINFVIKVKWLKIILISQLISFFAIIFDRNVKFSDLTRIGGRPESELQQELKS